MLRTIRGAFFAGAVWPIHPVLEIQGCCDVSAEVAKGTGFLSEIMT